MSSGNESVTENSASASAVWIDRGLLAVVLLACGLCVSHHNADPDLWGHVRYGLDLLNAGQIPAVNTFSYNAADHPWINHELLAELLMAGGMTVLGPSAMLLLKCAGGMAVFYAMFQFARRDKVSQFVAAIAVLLAAVNLMHFWVMRPQLYSYFMFAILIGLVQWVYLGWRNLNLLDANQRAELSDWNAARLRWLWLAVPMFAVWTNTHGAFAAGYCIFTCYLVLRSVESVFSGRDDRWRIVGTHAAIAVTSGLATLINPYSWRLHAWMLDSLGQARPEITEWLPPEYNIVWLPFWVLTAVVATSWLAGGRRDATHTFILAIVLLQSLEHRRHIAFFAILCGYWLAPVLGVAARRIGVGRDLCSFGEGLASASRFRFAAALGFCAAMLALNLSGQFAMITVKRDQYPVEAFRFMSERHMRGKLVTRFSWAQYALYAFGSDSPKSGVQIAFDGRFRTCYPQEIVDAYFDFAVGTDGLWPRNRGEHSPPAEPSRILHLNSPDLVLVDRNQTHAAQTMTSHSEGWTLLYQDKLAQLWGRSTIYADPKLDTYIPPEHRPISDSRQIGMVAWPAAELAYSARLPNSARDEQDSTNSKEASFWLSQSKPITNRLNHADSANSR